MNVFTRKNTKIAIFALAAGTLAVGSVCWWIDPFSKRCEIGLVRQGDGAFTVAERWATESTPIPLGNIAAMIQERRERCLELEVFLECDSSLDARLIGSIQVEVAEGGISDLELRDRDHQRRCMLHAIGSGALANSFNDGSGNRPTVTEFRREVWVHPENGKRFMWARCSLSGYEIGHQHGEFPVPPSLCSKLSGNHICVVCDPEVRAADLIEMVSTLESCASGVFVYIVR